jgi:hypothetical protein
MPQVEATAYLKVARLLIPATPELRNLDLAPRFLSTRVHQLPAMYRPGVIAIFDLYQRPFVVGSSSLSVVRELKAMRGHPALPRPRASPTS